MTLLARYGLYAPIVFILWNGIAHWKVYRSLPVDDSVPNPHLAYIVIQCTLIALPYYRFLDKANTQLSQLLIVALAILVTIVFLRRVAHPDTLYFNKVRWLLLDIAAVMALTGIFAQPCRWLDVTLNHSGCIWEMHSRNPRAQTLIETPAETLILSANYQSIHLWRMEYKQQIYSIRLTDATNSLTISPNGEQFISVGQESIRFWRLENGTLLYEHPLPATHWQTQSVYAPDGKTAVTASHSGVMIWDTSNGQQVNSGSMSSNAIAIAPDGHHIFVATHQGLNRYSYPDLTPEFTYSEKSTDHVHISANGLLVAATLPRNGQIWIWDVATGAVLHRLNWPNCNHEAFTIIRDLVISPDSTLIAGIADDNVARVWQLPDEMLIRTIQIPEHSHALHYARDNTLIISSHNGQTQRWKVYHTP